MDRKGRKVHERHDERILQTFHINETEFEVINTKHGLYRVLEKKRMNIAQVGNVILSIGIDELERHFKIAETHFDKQASWERQIDYVISIYDAVHDIVFMVGLHPHLKRITIVTVIPRVVDVKSNDIYGAYRIDLGKTIHTEIKETLPKGIELIHKKLNT